MDSGYVSYACQLAKRGHQSVLTPVMILSGSGVGLVGILIYYQSVFILLLLVISLGNQSHPMRRCFCKRLLTYFQCHRYEREPCQAHREKKRFGFSASFKKYFRSKRQQDEAPPSISGNLGLNLLHSPENPLVDIIFVHGLGGDSVKTWTKGGVLDNFWPQAWLPQDVTIQNARIHSFGYNSKFKDNNKNIWCVDLFGKNLISTMLINPELRDSDTPIILVAHSMGGLVVKQAYIQARADPIYDRLAPRMAAMVFLATPHRGSDHAKLLQGILALNNGSKAYVADLKPTSAIIHNINETFRGYSSDLQLWSLYETQKSKFRVASVMIVEPGSAILGYPGENTLPVAADHRSITKFASMTDPNFLVVIDVLAGVMDYAAQMALEKRHALETRRLQAIRDTLGISDTVAEHCLASKLEPETSEYCAWLLRQSIPYSHWKAGATPRIFWLNGPLGTGKSMIASSVARDLEASGYTYSFYSFEKGASVGECLKYMAWQMSCLFPRVRDRLWDMVQMGQNFHFNKESLCWKNLFISRIFQEKIVRHFWILDGLEKCHDASLLFETMLERLGPETPLKVFAAGRETPNLKTTFLRIGNGVASHHLRSSDTLYDLEAFAKRKADTFTRIPQKVRSDVLGLILNKSRGSFLWVSLVYQHLANSSDRTSLHSAFSAATRDMYPLYAGALEDMLSLFQSGDGVRFAQAVLLWTLHSVRPLRVQEISAALEYDQSGKFRQVRETIPATCCQFVVITDQDNVEMIHETARDFLLQPGIQSDIIVSAPDAHSRMVKACLAVLSRDDVGSDQEEEEPFWRYANEAWWGHLALSAVSTEAAGMCCEFLFRNMSTWAENTIITAGVQPLLQAAETLQVYAEAANSPSLASWAVKLRRFASSR